MPSRERALRDEQGHVQYDRWLYQDCELPFPPFAGLLVCTPEGRLLTVQQSPFVGTEVVWDAVEQRFIVFEETTADLDGEDAPRTYADLVARLEQLALTARAEGWEWERDEDVSVAFRSRRVAPTPWFE